MTYKYYTVVIFSYYTYLHWEYLGISLQCDCIWTSSWHAHFRPRRPAVLPLPRPLALAALEPLADLADAFQTDQKRSKAIKGSEDLGIWEHPGCSESIREDIEKSNRCGVTVRRAVTVTYAFSSVTDCNALQCHMCYVLWGLTFLLPWPWLAPWQ